ncbi:MAG: hypothetical protein JXR76_09985 [Deltaproteobacteria bacterium]|nr:hypothetical protein [Deltaproteobacteria bacterium]
MSSIDEIIKRSRKSGGFKTKGYFTLEAQKAKQKIAAFALPAVEYAVLEFIQSAIAAGAKFVDLSVLNNQIMLSFVGGFYSGQELAHLFDYLLLDTDDARTRAMRRLAVGIAAVLKDSPMGVVIESGNGTLNGSSRLEIADLNSPFSVGTPKSPIGGTFIRLAIPARSREWGRWLGEALQRTMESLNTVGYTITGEESDSSWGISSLVYERCLYSIVPLQLNGELITGYTTQKAMQMRHLRAPVAFDEGDLYGGLGMTYDEDRPAEIKVLTNGIWVTSIKPMLPRGISGVVGYERLHKTASQYGIVADERMAEMTERLKPYVDQILARLGLTAEERWAALFQRPITGLHIPDTTNHFDVLSKDGARTAILEIWPATDDDGEADSIDKNEQNVLQLTVISERGSIIDTIGVPFEGEAQGVLQIDFHFYSLDIVYYRTLEEADYHTSALVGLKSEFYNDLFLAMGIDWRAASLRVKEMALAQKQNQRDEAEFLKDSRNTSSEDVPDEDPFFQTLLSKEDATSASLAAPTSASSEGNDTPQTPALPRHHNTFPSATELRALFDTMEFKDAICAQLAEILQFAFAESSNRKIQKKSVRVKVTHRSRLEKPIRIIPNALSQMDVDEGLEPLLLVEINSDSDSMQHRFAQIAKDPTMVYLLVFTIFDELRETMDSTAETHFEKSERAIYRPMIMNLRGAMGASEAKPLLKLQNS